MMDFERLKEYRGEILWWEICGLLHDIGKLSAQFLEYRATWQQKERGYADRDPHDQCWFNRDPLFEVRAGGGAAKFSDLRKFFGDEIPVKRSLEGRLSAQDAAHGHISDQTWDGHQLLYLLKRGDGSDSRIDRNNPLFGCEQKPPAGTTGDAWPRFRSNVFGYEGERMRVFPEILESARTALYKELDEKFKPFYELPDGTRKAAPEGIGDIEFISIRDTIRKYFEPAMADTTRPSNDTSLWEHTYSVASLAKALHALEVLRAAPDDAGIGPLAEDERMRWAQFRLWGVGFDSWRYLSQSHRIGDILGRRHVLKDVARQVRRLVEWEYPCANCVYQDDDSLVFLAPPFADGAAREFQEKFGGEAAATASEASKGELAPHFYLTQVTGSLTKIVSALEKLRELRNIPFAEPAAERKAPADDLARDWPGRPIETRARPNLIAERFAAARWPRNASICAICRMRPAKHDAGRRVCNECLDRRRQHTEGFNRNAGPAQTPLISEIAENGRAALLAARFELRPWLSGKMIRTTFVTQAQLIDDTLAALRETSPGVKIPDLDDDRALRGAWLATRGATTYTRMLGEFQALRGYKGTPTRGTADAADWLFLYGRDIVTDESKKGGIALNRSIDRANQDWDAELAEYRDEFRGAVQDDGDLLHIVCAKSPTPSSVLDAWETTEEFFKVVGAGPAAYGQFGNEDETPWLARLEGLGPQPRRWVQLERGVKLDDHQACIVRLGGRECEAVYERDEHRLWLAGERGLDFDCHKGDRLEIIDQDANEVIDEGVASTAPGKKADAYYPFRVISASPNLLLAIVPAKKAVTVASELYARYLEEFGKVYGRLPFSIGLVFFQEHTPMFAALDAARRMNGNFADLQSEKPLTGRLHLPPAEWKASLGEGDTDWHHPYVATVNPHADKASYFRTSSDPFRHLIHISEAGDVDDAVFWPNLFDCEFLGASADRFRVALDGNWRARAPDLAKAPTALRSMRGGPYSGPVLLDDLDGKMTGLWNLLREWKATDSGTRNFEFLLRSRLEAWRTEEGRDAAIGLAGSLAGRFFKGEAREAVLEAARSGFLFRTLDLYLRILKDRLEERGNQDGSSSGGDRLHGADVPGPGPGSDPRRDGGVPAGQGR